MWHSHTTEYYSAMNSNEVSTRATTGVSLEDSTISERNHSQKTTYCMTRLYNRSKIGNSFETETRVEVV